MPPRSSSSASHGHRRRAGALARRHLRGPDARHRRRPGLERPLAARRMSRRGHGDGVRRPDGLHWESTGDGAAVLLIMGLGLSGGAWWRTVPVLARRCASSPSTTAASAVRRPCAHNYTRRGDGRRRRLGPRRRRPRSRARLRLLARRHGRAAARAAPSRTACSSLVLGATHAGGRRAVLPDAGRYGVLPPARDDADRGGGLGIGRLQLRAALPARRTASTASPRTSSGGSQHPFTGAPTGRSCSRRRCTTATGGCAASARRRWSSTARDDRIIPVANARHDWPSASRTPAADPRGGGPSVPDRGA